MVENHRLADYVKKMGSSISRRSINVTLIDQIALVWLVITACVLNNQISNEVDVLPFARHFVDNNWIPNDWYLNLDIDYRIPFNTFFGSIVSILGFQYGAILGRLLVYLVLAIAIRSLCHTIKLRFWIGIVVLLFFLNHQSLVADEWMVGGVDTKTLAYALAILSCSAFIQKKYPVGFAFAGAAMSFHALVGAFALFCTLFAVFLTIPQRSDWHRIIKSSWVFLVTGFWGLFVTYRDMLPQNGIDSKRAWEIYVQYRVPHHVLPSAWAGDYWVIELVLAISLFVIVYIAVQSDTIRFLAAYALGSTVLFMVGLLIFMFGDIELLRFYWFRFPDVMIPFLSVMLTAVALNAIANTRVPQKAFNSSHWHRVSTILPKVIYGILIIVIAISLIRTFNYDSENQTTEDSASSETLVHPMFVWIENNTPEESVFLVDPTMDNFYVEAQRAMFVSFKHSPQSADDILEWYRRIELCNGGTSPDSAGFLSEAELHANFYRLDERSIQQISRVYGIKYYLGHADETIGFELVHSTTDFALYRIA